MRRIFVVALALVALAAPAEAKNVCRDAGMTGDALKNCSIKHYVSRPAGCHWATSYGNGDGYLGKPMANGGRLDRSTPTVAHLTKRLGSRVTLRHGSRSVMVTVTDRGPYRSVAAYDLSPAAGRALGFEGESGYVCDGPVEASAQ